MFLTLPPYVLMIT